MAYITVTLLQTEPLLSVMREISGDFQDLWRVLDLQQDSAPDAHRACETISLLELGDTGFHFTRPVAPNNIASNPVDCIIWG